MVCLNFRSSIAGILFFLCYVISGAGNLLEHSGFEAGTDENADGWSRFDSCGRQAWAGRDGTPGMALYGWADQGCGGTWQDVTGQTPDTWYAFSVDILAETNFYANSVCLKLEWYDESGTKLYETEYEVSSLISNDWTRFTHMAKSPRNTRQVRVVVAGWTFHPPAGASTDMACKFDNAELVITNLPETEPVITGLFVSAEGHASLQWASEQRRHDAAWRSLYPNEWLQTYTLCQNDGKGIALWQDEESWDQSCMLYRIERGEILIPGTTERCTADGSTGVTYVRFLPSSYTPQGTNPVVIALDPNGGGSYMASVLRPSAERYGWVVIGCDTIANGGDPLHDRRFVEILRDVRRRIPHDRTRCYLSGFSGGAYRGNEYARYLWNQFAGIISYGGWIGNYDDYTVLPSRYAVARLRGDEDGGAAAWEDRDKEYFEQSGCSVRDYVFSGGHQTASPEWNHQAFDWLNQDFATNGIHQIKPNHHSLAPHALSDATAAVRQGNWQRAATQAVWVINQYPYSWEAYQCESLLFDIFTNTTKAASVVFDPSDPLAKEQSWGFMSYGLIDEGGFPADHRRTYMELALALNPSNAIACSYLSRILTEQPELTSAERTRATQLADTCITTSNLYWRGWFAKAWCAAEAGDYHAATGYVAQARELTDRHPMYYNRRDDCDDARDFFESQIP